MTSSDPRTFAVGIGSRVFGLQFLEAGPWLPLVRERLKGFERAGTVDWTLVVEVVRHNHHFDPRPRFQWDGDAFQLEFSTFRAKSQGTEGRIRGTVLDSGNPEDVAEWTLSLLRSLATELLRKDDTLVFHAAALTMTSSLGVLVVGPRGAGKTTFASGSWVQSRYSDDHGMVRWDDSPWLVGVPFTGREHRPTQVGRSLLDVIALPVHGEPGHAPICTQLSRRDATQMLLEHLICIDDAPETFTRNLTNVLKLVDTVPVISLRYHPNTSSEDVSASLIQATGALQKAS